MRKNSRSRVREEEEEEEEEKEETEEEDHLVYFVLLLSSISTSPASPPHLLTRLVKRQHNKRSPTSADCNRHELGRSLDISLLAGGGR